MRLIDQQPMWPAGARPQVRDFGQQAREEWRPLCQLEGLRVDDDIGADLADQLERFVARRRRLGVADTDGVFQVVIVTFRVEYAELELLLGHAFGQGGCERGFPD